MSGLLGPLAIIGACAAWGLDNNLTRKVSLADPLQIVELKGLIAGPVSLALGLASWALGNNCELDVLACVTDSASPL